VGACDAVTAASDVNDLFVEDSKDNEVCMHGLMSTPQSGLLVCTKSNSPAINDQ